MHPRPSPDRIALNCPAGQIGERAARAEERTEVRRPPRPPLQRLPAPPRELPSADGGSRVTEVGRTVDTWPGGYATARTSAAPSRCLRSRGDKLLRDRKRGIARLRRRSRRPDAQQYP
ncbi:hypothetical protein GCM10023237_32650 [Streptomyces coeruleoprunus]